MEILGIGASELIFILLIAIIVLGPKDMQKAGKTVGRWLNQFVKSDSWKALQQASKEIRNIPTSLMREANLEELKEMDRDIRNNIDPRPRPPAPKSDRGQSPPGPATPPVKTDLDNTESQASPPRREYPPQGSNDPEEK
jgi:sec-independent protein translocase protein TatB